MNRRALFQIFLSFLLMPIGRAAEPPENATCVSPLANAFLKNLEPGMDEVAASARMKGSREEILSMDSHWISMLAGFVPLQFVFQREDVHGYAIVPPQTQLRACKKRDEIRIYVTIEFPGLKPFAANGDDNRKIIAQALSDFLLGKRKGRLLEFAICFPTRGASSEGVTYYAGPASPPKPFGEGPWIKYISQP
jgi:hypothetical protein